MDPGGCDGFDRAEATTDPGLVTETSHFCHSSSEALASPSGKIRATESPSPDAVGVHSGRPPQTESVLRELRIPPPAEGD